jgi:vancomycin permeability regulator SanA
MQKKFKNGKINRFYINRIDATVNLFNANKIDIIIVSRNQGNVVEEVKKDLIKRGIPKNKIILDYAGLRTYDSMYRMYKVYGQKEFIIIAQHKQNERAIYIAKKNIANFNIGLLEKSNNKNVESFIYTTWEEAEYNKHIFGSNIFTIQKIEETEEFIEEWVETDLEINN